jgi:hypothetical protein
MTEKCADRTYVVGGNAAFAGHALKSMHNTAKVLRGGKG